MTEIENILICSRIAYTPPTDNVLNYAPPPVGVVPVFMSARHCFRNSHYLGCFIKHFDTIDEDYDGVGECDHDDDDDEDDGICRVHDTTGTPPSGSDRDIPGILLCKRSVLQMSITIRLSSISGFGF